MDNRREIEIDREVILGEELSLYAWGDEPIFHHMILQHKARIQVAADYDKTGAVVIKSRLIIPGNLITDIEVEDYLGSAWEDILDVIEDEETAQVVSEYAYYGVSPKDFS